MKSNKMNFIVNRSYELVTDYPAPFPKILTNPVDQVREESTLSPLFMSEMKPLLIGCDLGLGIDELNIRAMDYNHAPEGATLHPDDQRIIDQA